MPKIPIIKAKDFLSELLAYGCEIVSVNGSHHKIKNPKNGKTTTIPIHGGKDLKKGLFPAILKALNIDVIEFLNFIKK